VVRVTLRLLYPRRKTPDAHWLGGWVGPRAGLEAVEKNGRPFPVSTGNRTPIRPARI